MSDLHLALAVFAGSLLSNLFLSAEVAILWYFHTKRVSKGLEKVRLMEQKKAELLQMIAERKNAQTDRRRFDS
jgi:hypothetical protein